MKDDGRPFWEAGRVAEEAQSHRASDTYGEGEGGCPSDYRSEARPAVGESHPPPWVIFRLLWLG
jgi:hypothetical protein